ncbi:MAG TPA: VanZ family protein [Symbiobacteriaceae bacterium]|nr:VanZ family protein [Symbiobacteriaceae bacterium]
MALDPTSGSTSVDKVTGWRLWLRWGMLVAWMALIFQLSATPDLRTVPLAQRFHLLPGVLGVELTNLLEFALRKAAHLAAFGVLAALAFRALSGSRPGWPRRRLYLTSALFTVLYAASDEWHQTFVPTRSGSLRDVAIDTAGAVAALLFIYFRALQRSFGPSRQI